jgi:hypothetical protein
MHNRSAAISLVMGGNLCRMNQNTYVEMVAGDWGFFACCFAPENNAICLEMLHCGECIKKYADRSGICVTEDLSLLYNKQI